MNSRSPVKLSAMPIPHMSWNYHTYGTDTRLRLAVHADESFEATCQTNLTSQTKQNAVLDFKWYGDGGKQTREHNWQSP